MVTEIPGTTRDTISEPFALDGVPVTLIDTAGIRKTTDEIELMGVERARRTASDSDLLVVVIDGSQPLNEEDELVLKTANGKPYVIALNKRDLQTFSTTQLSHELTAEMSVSVSAVTQHGL